MVSAAGTILTQPLPHCIPTHFNERLIQRSELRFHEALQVLVDELEDEKELAILM